MINENKEFITNETGIFLSIYGQKYPHKNGVHWIATDGGGNSQLSIHHFLGNIFRHSRDIIVHIYFQF